MSHKSNKVDNYEALYCTLCLLCLEVITPDNSIAMFKLAISIQVRWGPPGVCALTCTYDVTLLILMNS